MSDSAPRGIDPRDGDTHCPYCALQCGMTLTAEHGRYGRSRPAIFRPTGAACAARAGPRATLLDAPRPPDRAAGARPQGRRAASGELGRGARLHRRPPARHPGGARARDAVGVFGGGGLTNEKAYMLGKFARVALRTAEHRLQRPLLHGLGRGGGPARLRHRPRAAVSRSRTSPTPRRSCWSAATRPTPCRR